VYLYLQQRRRARARRTRWRKGIFRRVISEPDFSWYTVIFGKQVIKIENAKRSNNSFYWKNYGS